MPNLDALVEMSAEEVLVGTRAQLEQLPPEQREAAEAQLAAFAAQWEGMSPEERRAFLQEQQAAGEQQTGALTNRARAAAQRGEFTAACTAQEAAIAQLRETLARQGESREGLVSLSVLLYNLAGYLQGAGRFDEAVTALEEVVALDERTGHEALASDRAKLEGARQLAAMSPEERERLEAGSSMLGTGSSMLDAGRLDALVEMSAEQVLAGTRAQLEGLPPEQREVAEAQLAAFAAQWEGMSPEERRAFLQEQQAAGEVAAQRDEITSLVERARDAAINALREEGFRGVYVERTREILAQIEAQHPPAGSPWDEVAQYLRALLALVQGEEVPPVPAAYAAEFAAVKDEG